MAKCDTLQLVARGSTRRRQSIGRTMESSIRCLRAVDCKGLSEKDWSLSTTPCTERGGGLSPWRRKSTKREEGGGALGIGIWGYVKHLVSS